MMNINDIETLFKSNPIPIWICAPLTLRLQYTNEAACHNYGYSKAELTEHTAFDLLTPDSSELLKQALSHNTPQNTNVFNVKAKNGEIKQAKIIVQNITLSNQNYLLLTCVDVTEEYHKLNLLQDADTKLKSAAAIANLGFWRLELNANSLTWTDEVFIIWGLSHENFLSVVLKIENFWLQLSKLATNPQS